MWRDIGVGLALGAVSAATLFTIFRLGQPGGFLPIRKITSKEEVAS